MEFLSSFLLTGVSDEGALYVFFRLDRNDDLKLTMDEVDENFGLVDTDGEFATWCSIYTNVIYLVLEVIKI